MTDAQSLNTPTMTYTPFNSANPLVAGDAGTYKGNGQTVTAEHVAFGVLLVTVNGGPSITMDKQQLASLLALLIG